MAAEQTPLKRIASDFLDNPVAVFGLVLFGLILLTALLGSGAEFQISCVAAANPDLHQAVVRELDLGIERLARAMAA